MLWVDYAAAFWAFAFAGLHVVWATGMYVGLDQQEARALFAQPWFLAYDVVVVVLCVIAGLIALAAARSWKQHLGTRWVGLAAGGGTVLLGLRGGLGIAQAIDAAMSRSFVFRPMQVWDAWFCLGAVLFGLVTRQYWTLSRRRSPAER